MRRGQWTPRGDGQRCRCGRAGVEGDRRARARRLRRGERGGARPRAGGRRRARLPPQRARQDDEHGPVEHARHRRRRHREPVLRPGDEGRGGCRERRRIRPDPLELRRGPRHRGRRPSACSSRSASTACSWRPRHPSTPPTCRRSSTPSDRWCSSTAPCPSCQVDTVIAANRSGARRLTSLLLAAGHRRIAFISTLAHRTDFRRGDTLSTSSVAERVRGLRRDARRRGRARTRGVRAPERATEGVERLARRILDDDRGITAIVSSDSLIALGVFRAARALGRSIPRDLSLVAFDDADWTGVTTPASP